jgi:uncharacterized protein (TIGR02453 family)
MAFEGWQVEAIEFFERLEDDNTKTFWTEHKHVYDQCVKAPMEELLSELERRCGESKIFRPHRDVRFSKDKTPYKTNIAATMAKGGYVSLSADGLATGTGYYMMAKDQLAKYRAAVDENKTGRQLQRIFAKLADAGIDVTAHDSLKTAPRGYAKDHPRIELLRMKGCIAWQQWDVGAWLGTPEARDRIVAVLDSAKPLVKWLDTNVGPTELVDERSG